LRALKNSDGHGQDVILRHRECILGVAASSTVGDVDVTNEKAGYVRFAGNNVLPYIHSKVDGSRVDVDDDHISVRLSNDSIHSALITPLLLLAALDLLCAIQQHSKKVHTR
jgi:hypothetical protein